MSYTPTVSYTHKFVGEPIDARALLGFIDELVLLEFLDALVLLEILDAMVLLGFLVCCPGSFCSTRWRCKHMSKISVVCCLTETGLSSTIECKISMRSLAAASVCREATHASWLKYYEAT